MNLTEELPSLSDEELRIFRAFCERAVTSRNLLAPIAMDEVASSQDLADMDRNAVGRSAVALVEQGYLYRAGRAHYTITPGAFETYAQRYIERYEVTDAAVKEALATVDRTDTDAIVVGTGEPWYLVNHILRQLQRQREIEAFVSTADRIHVTRVSGSFKRKQASHKPPG
jgi:hypothetical protein